MSKGVKFDYPYFITNHAIESFQDKIYTLKPADIIILLQFWLQGKRDEPLEVYQKDCKINALYRAEFGGLPVYIPVVANKGREWPTVPTVYGEESIIHAKYLKGEL